jgi:hypothetical protein
MSTWSDCVAKRHGLVHPASMGVGRAGAKGPQERWSHEQFLKFLNLFFLITPNNANPNLQVNRRRKANG